MTPFGMDGAVAPDTATVFMAAAHFRRSRRLVCIDFLYSNGPARKDFGTFLSRAPIVVRFVGDHLYTSGPQRHQHDYRGMPAQEYGMVTPRSKELLAGDIEAVVQRLVEAAKDGKPWAMRLVIERLVPSRRSSAVEVELPRMERACDIALGVQAVIEAAAAGEITLDEAREFCALLEWQRKILETSELEVRIEALEKGEARK